MNHDEKCNQLTTILMSCDATHAERALSEASVTPTNAKILLHKADAARVALARAVAAATPPDLAGLTRSQAVSVLCNAGYAYDAAAQQVDDAFALRETRAAKFLRTL